MFSTAFGNLSPVLKESGMKFFDGFRWSRQPVPNSSSVTDWGHLIYSYVTQLYGASFDLKREDRARNKIEGRGLAFGQIKILGGGSRSIKLGIVGKQKLTAEQVRVALVKTLKDRNLNDKFEIRNGFSTSKLEVIFKDPSDQTFSGACWSGFRNGESSNWKEFLSIYCWDSGGLYEAEVHSDEAVRVFLQTVGSLGFCAGPKHYAHETPVCIEDVVVYASRWEDPESGCRYLDALWRPELVKHQVWHGSGRSDNRTEGAFQGEVLACEGRGRGDWWPKMTINNRPVYSTIVQTPTVPMLKAKEKFAKDSIRRCGCGDLATQQVFLVRFETSGDFGGDSMGGVDYTCDKKTCLDRAKAQKCIRAQVMPYKQEVWA